MTFRPLSVRWLCLFVVVIELQAATLVVAEPPVLRPSDGAPGEGGPFQVDQFAQQKKDISEQAEPAQRENASPADLPDHAEAAPSDDDDASGGVSIALDATDHLAPVDKAWQSAWQRAIQASRQRNWPRVVQQLVPIIGRPDGSPTEDAMIRLPDGTLRSAGLEAARLLLQLPMDVRAERGRELKAAGSAATEQAIRSGDLRELQRIAIHYAGTPVGEAAADQLIALLVDRGHFGLAAAWSTLLATSQSAVSETEHGKRRHELIEQVLARSEHHRPGHSKSDRGKSDTSMRQLARTLTPETPEALSEWLLVGGNARRHAVAVAGIPTLVRRWSAVSTSDPQLAGRIDRMIDDLTYDGRSSVPVGVPLFVNGQVALRTLRGIEVRDVETGQLFWMAGQRRSLEGLLSGTDSSDGEFSFDHFDDGGFAASELPVRFQASDPTGGALGQALYQNATYGFLSSDGERLFAISDDPVYSLGRTSIRNRKGREFSPEPGSASANQLEAFDLANGHLLWRLGGPATDEPATPPLSGWFFLGVPLVTDDGLFVIAQNSETIRLFCLDAATARVRWSQRIGWSDDRLDRDLNRRLWAALPALAHGVLVCPTSAGWVIGVDSATGTLLWGHRFSTRTPESGNGTPGLFLRNRGMLEVANRRVDSHWVAAPPVIAGTSVLLTPPETKDANDPSTGIIVCLDLFTGRRLWELPRRDANQLVAVTESLAILAGSRSIDALSLDGREAWQFKLPDEVAQIDGRVLASEDTLLVPTQSGDVFAVSVDDGKLRQRWSQSGRQRPPGSLYSYRGLLISVHPAEVSAYELQNTLEQKLQQSAAGDGSLQLTIQRAELALARGNTDEARHVLQGRQVGAVSEADRAAFDAAVLKTAGSIQTMGPDIALQFLEMTPQLSDSVDVAGQRALLQIQTLHRLQRRSEAFRELIRIAASPEYSHRQIPQPDAPRVEVSMLSWAQSKLSELWGDLNEDERQQVDSEIRRLLTPQILTVQSRSKETSRDAAARERTARLATTFAFHPSGQTLLVELAQAAGRDEQSAEAALWWQAVSRTATEPKLVVEAQLQAALREFPLLTARGRAWQLSTIEKRMTEHGLTSNATLSKLLEAVATLHREEVARTHPARQAGVGEPRPPTVSLQRLAGSEYESKAVFLTNESGEPVAGQRFPSVFVSRDFEENRLNVRDREDDGLTWSIQLGSAYPRGVQPVVRRVGSLLITLLENRLTGLSVLDRRILWSRQLPGEPWRGRGQNPFQQAMASGDEWLAQLEQDESIAVSSGTGEFLCCRSARQIVVLETRTGRLCWSRDGLLDSQRVRADREAVYVLNSRGKSVAGYRLADGKPLSAELLALDRLPVLRRDQWGFVTAELAGDEVIVQRVDSGQTVWERRFPADSRFRQIGDTDLAVMKSRGHFETLDLRTGEVSDFPRIPADRRVRKDRVIVLPDSERWILLLQGEQVGTPEIGGVRGLNAQGTLVGFQRGNATAEPWFYDSGESGLPLDEFSRMPFLILLRESGSPLVPLAKTRHLTLLDRRTGQPVLDPSGKQIDDLTMPGGASLTTVNVPDDERYIELWSSTERLRLSVQQQ
ncbi:PQQ-binding-like beta-propeller repeat protein [bacterium]|nr:PQQ-binding-like beta-propeller repeat protein [bacterium]